MMRDSAYSESMVRRAAKQCDQDEGQKMKFSDSFHEVVPRALAPLSARVAVIVSHAVKPPLQERRGDGYLRTQNDRDARCYSWLPLHFCNVVVLFGWHLTGQFPLFLEGLARKVIPFDD